MAATFGWEVEGSFHEGGSSVPSIKVSPAVPLSYSTGFCVNAYTVEEQLSFSYYAMASGKPNSDFNQSSDFAGTYCVGPGQSSVSLTGITAINDGVTEGTEDIYVCIQSWDDSEFGANGDFIRPIDEDEADTGNGYPYCWLADITETVPPTVDFNVTSSSGAESVSSAALQVDLSAQSTSAVTVDYAVTGTATGGGTDYTLANGTLTIPANTSSANITIGSIVDDNLYEGNETVIVTLSNPSGATLGTDTVHTYTINENDTLPSLTIADISSAEGALGANSQPNVRVSLSHPSTQSISFQWETQDGTATSADTDYGVETGATLYISAGDMFVDIPPVIFGDDAFENDENFSILLTNAVNATIADNTGIVTITNDDSAPSLSVSLLGNAIEGNGNALIRIEPSTVAGVPITFDYTTSDGTASAGVEYSLTSGTATINAGAPDISIPVPMLDNSVDNSDKNFTFTISNSSNATIAVSSTMVSIIDDEATISINDITVSESANTATLTVTVQGPMMAANLDVDYATANGTATAGTDYTLNSGTISFSSANSPPFGVSETETITISLSDDAIIEGSEYFEVNLSNIVTTGSVVMSDGVGRITITDNDAATVDFNVTSSSGAESVSSAALQVDLSAQSTSAVTVDYAVTGTATGGGTDYTLANGTLTIPANTSSANITIGSIVDDTLVEGSETVIVTLSNPSGATLGTDTVHTYTITDNDAAPTVSISGTASLSEAVGSQSFSVSLNAPATTIYTIDYNTSDNTATSPDDYSSNSGTLSFAIGEITKTITVNIVDDDTQEGTEIFFVQLLNPTGGVSLGVSSLTVMISDNDNGVSNAELDAAEKFVTSISDKLAEEKGGDLIEASHRLIRASLDNLILRSNISASATSEQNTANGFLKELTREERRRNFFEISSMQTEKTESNLLRKAAGGIKNIVIDADDFGHNLNFDYDHIMPLIKTDKRLISKFSIQSSKQKDGPTARRLIASAAIEKDVDDKASVLGRFVHITNEKADFNTSYLGEKKSNSVNLGIYKVYSPDVNALKSMYISAGIADTDLQLKKNGMLMESSYLSYLFQGGIAAGKVYKNKSFNSILEFSLDALYDYQTGHQLDITSGISKFSRVMDGKERYEFIGRFEPKLNYKIESESRRVTVLQFIPLLKCGVGSMDPDCGGGFGTKISTSLGQRSDHFSIGLRYENYRDTDFWEYTMNSNQSLYKRENLRLITNLKIEERLFEASKRTNPYSINSEIRMKF